MTLADFEALALGNNPTLRQAAANVQAARGRWVQVGLRPNPMGGYLATEIGDEGRAGQQGGFISQEIVTGGKLELNRDIATQEIRRTQAEFAAQRGRVLTDVRMHFFDVLVAQRGVEIAGELMRIGRETSDATDQLLKGKLAAPLDVLQVDVELETARIQQQNAKNRHLGAWRRLAAVVGVPQMQQVTIVGDLDQLLPRITWEDAVVRVIGASPELAAAQARANRARSAVERAIAQRVPNIEAEASVQHDNATSDDIVGVQIGLPIPLFNRNQGGIRQTESELVSARANAARVELALTNRLAVAFEQYSNARSQVEAYSQRILPKARKSLDIVTNARRLGKQFSYPTVLVSQRTYFQANVAYLSALVELKRSEALIEGLMLSDSLNAPALDSTPDAAIPTR